MPVTQPGLFDELGLVAPLVPLVRSNADRKLTNSQRRFNKLAARVQELRALLATWQRAVDGFRQRAIAELEPLQRELLAEQRAAVLFIDALLSGTAKSDRLTRRRREKLKSLVVSLAGAALEAGADPDIEAAFDRHGFIRHRDLRRGEFEMAEALVGAMVGDDVMEGHTATDVDELLEQAGERFTARLNAEAEKRGKKAEARRAKSQHQRVDAERQASQSVRDVFRRLVVALHPDREPDAAERQRKTALMQRVNRAYEANDLFELLTVQMEIEQIDSVHLERASEERLGHYCAVLLEQQRALEVELDALQAPFVVALDGSPFGTGFKPEAVDVLLDRDLADARDALESLRLDMAAIRDPSLRNATIDGIPMDADEPDFLDDAFLAEALAPPVRSAKKKRKRRR